MNVTKLKQQVKAAQKASAKKIADAAEVAALKAALALESDPNLFKARVQLAVTSGYTKTLQDLVNTCSGIIDATPIENAKTKTTRVWAGSNRFTFGTQINLMYQLATGIMYSCAEHKQLLLAHTGIQESLVEQFVEAFGSPAYYSRNFNTLVEAKPYDVDAVLSSVRVMQSILGVDVDIAQLTAENFSLEFGKGEVRAFEDKAKAEEAIAAVDLAI